MSRFLRNTSEQLPDAVYAELVDILFTGLVPISAIGVIVMCIGILIGIEERDVTIWALTSGAVLLTILRVMLILAYRRRAAISPLKVEEARVWERRYAVGSFGFAILLAALSVRALAMDDDHIPILITGLVFGYGSGVVVRVAIRPWICISNLMVVLVPTILAFGMHLNGAEGSFATAIYVGQMLLLASFAIASLEATSHGYRTILQQLMTKRDLAALAGQDVLTGLPNRVLLRARFDESAARIGRNGDLLALHCLDLDHFKAVNDTFGHPTGDALLQAVAERLARTLQAGDTVARLGGDEFVVVQSGLHHADEARLLALRIIRVVSAPYSLKGQIAHIGVSVGIALAPQDGLDMEQLISHADAALYQAKHEGRGGVVFAGEAPLPLPLWQVGT